MIDPSRTYGVIHRHPACGGVAFYSDWEDEIPSKCAHCGRRVYRLERNHELGTWEAE